MKRGKLTQTQIAALQMQQARLQDKIQMIDWMIPAVERGGSVCEAILEMVEAGGPLRSPFHFGITSKEKRR